MPDRRSKIPDSTTSERERSREKEYCYKGFRKVYCSEMVSRESQCYTQHKGYSQGSHPLNPSYGTASTTYRTCCGLTKSPRDSELETSDTEGEALLILFARSTLSWSPSHFKLLWVLLPLQSILRRRLPLSSPNSHSDDDPMSK